MAQYTGPEGLARWKKEYLDTDPIWQKYRQQGRVPDLTYSQGAKQESDYAAIKADFLRRVQAEDAKAAQLFEIYTGRTPTQAEVDNYAKWASDPAMLEAAISQGARKAPATGQYNDVVNATIQDKLGRPATQAELGFFGKQMEQGAVDPYTLQQFIENTNEYQTKASETARGKLATELAGYDKPYMEQVGKQLEAKYSAQGRPGAGAFGSALIKAGQELARGRGEYLSGLGYQDFLRGQGNLRSDYENRLSQMYGQQQQAAQLAQESRNRYYSTQDFERQLAAQERLARLNQPKSQSFLQSMAPGLLQAGLTVAGTALAGPAGGAAGSALGSSYMNRNPRLNIGYY